MGCAASSSVAAHGLPGDSPHATISVSETTRLAEQAGEKSQGHQPEIQPGDPGVLNDDVHECDEESRQIVPPVTDDEPDRKPWSFGRDDELAGARGGEEPATPDPFKQPDLPSSRDDESGHRPGSSYGLADELIGARDVKEPAAPRRARPPRPQPPQPERHALPGLPPFTDDEPHHKPDSRCWSSSLHGLRVSVPNGFDPTALAQGDASDRWRHGIGIDLGTSAAVVSVWINGSAEIVPDAEGRRNHPMYLNFDSESGMLTFGAEAKRRAARGLGVTVRNIKRLIGNSVHDPWLQEEVNQMQFDVISGDDGTPVIVVPFREQKLKLHISHCMALMLRYLYTLAQQYMEARAPGSEQDRRVVLTTPAAFGFYNRQVVKDAADIAGLETIRMLSEPTVAALPIAVKSAEEDAAGGESNVCVFDLGAGTLDVTVCTIEEGILEVKATMGDNRLGAEDFDNIVVQYLINKIKELHGQDRFAAVMSDTRAMHILRAAAERSKCSLSFEEEATVAADSLQDGFSFLYHLTRREFESIVEKLLARCMELVRKCLKDAKMSPSEIQNVVLVGGSTRIPRLQQLLEAEFGSNKIDWSGSDPDEAVAIGAALQAAILSGSSDTLLQEVMVLDVIPSSVQVATTGGSEENIVRYNTTIPVKKQQGMTTANEGQETVSVCFMEGMRDLVESNRFLGKILLDKISPAPAGVPEIDVVVDLDANGIISVTVKDKISGNEEELTLNGCPLLPPDAMKEMISATETLFKSSMICTDAPGDQLTGDAGQASRANLKPWQRVTVEEALHDAERALSEAPEQLVPDANRGCYFPMYVMSVDDFLAMERLIPHEEALSRGLLKRVRRDNGAGDFFYPIVGGNECRREKLRFISHRWLSGEEAIPHPDTPSNTKLRLLQRLIRKQTTTVGAEAFIWMDYYSMPQARRETAGLAIASLPFYVHSCGMFTAVLSDEYLHRAWCQVELIVSKLPVKDSLWRAKQLMANKTFVNLADGTESPIPMTVLRNPRTCGIKCPEDLDGIMSLVHYVERTLTDFVAWDRSPSRRFEKRFGGKAAEPYCVDEDPECQKMGLKLADIELALEQIRATT